MFKKFGMSIMIDNKIEETKYTGKSFMSQIIATKADTNGKKMIRKILDKGKKLVKTLKTTVIALIMAIYVI